MSRTLFFQLSKIDCTLVSMLNIIMSTTIEMKITINVLLSYLILKLKLFNDEQGFQIVRMRIGEAHNKSRWMDLQSYLIQLYVVIHHLFTIDSS
jgi:hypothetical protein